MRNINTLSQKKNMKKTFKQKIVYSLLNKIFYKVDHIVNQCNAMKNDLLSLHSLNPKNVSVIYTSIQLFIMPSTTRTHKWSMKYKRSINCRRPRGLSCSTRALLIHWSRSGAVETSCAASGRHQVATETCRKRSRFSRCCRWRAIILSDQISPSGGWGAMQ